MNKFLRKNNAIFANNYFDYLDNLVNLNTSLVICSNFYSKTNSFACLINLLSKKRKILVISNVPANPSIKYLENLLHTLNQNIENIIAIGGGSVIDIAKLIKTNTIFNVLECKIENKLFYKKKYLYVIPTTAGTGSEMTPFSTLWDYEKKRKISIESKYMLPDFIILSPKMLLTHSENGLLYPFLDSVSHCLESLWNKNKNSISEDLAYRILNNINKLFYNFEAKFKNLHFLKKIQWNSFLAGYLISYTKTSIAHAISYPLTLNYKVPHGLACSFSLPVIIDSYIEFEKPNFYNKKCLTDLKKNIENLELLSRLLLYLNKEDLSKLINGNLEKSRLNNFIIKPEIIISRLDEVICLN